MLHLNMIKTDISRLDPQVSLLCYDSYGWKASSYAVRCVRALGTLTLSSTSQTFTSTGGTANVTVTGSGAWTAVSTLSWATITSGASGTGNGTVVISVAANTTGATRTGNITIAGQTFTITQSAAASTCTYSISPTSQTFTSFMNFTGSVTVTASNSSCSWTTSTSLGWVTILSGSGTGSGTATFGISENITGISRTGNITMAGQTFTITQSPAGGSSVSLLTSAAQTSYSTIQAAYDANTAASGSSILVQEVTLAETLVFNRNNSITLTGGYDSTFTTVGATMTTVSGSLTISGGVVTVANIVIQ